MDVTPQNQTHLHQLIIRYINEEPKDESFIIKWMSILANDHEDAIELWRMLIRDSQFIVIDLPNHELHNNFANFLEDVLQNYTINKCAPLLQEFCIQTITNNPDVLLNRYYVGNGGCPIYEMLAMFLITGETYRFTIHHEIELFCFNTLKFWIEQETEKNYCFAPSYFNLVYLNSSNTFLFPKVQRFETIKLLLETFSFCLNQHDDLKNMRYNQFEELFFNDQYHGFRKQNRFEMKNWIFNFSVPKFLAQIFEVLGTNIRRIDWSRSLEHLQRQEIDFELYESVELPKAQEECWLILEMINEKYWQLLNLYDEKIIKEIYKIISKKVFIKVCERLPNFKLILFSEAFIFKILEARNFPLIEEIWSDKKYQKIISEMRKNGKNILETICESYSLTHKIIIVLWNSGLFSELPEIKNKKSKQIVLQHFQ